MRVRLVQRVVAAGAAWLGILWALEALGAEVTTGTDEQARLLYWQLRDRGVSIRFVQRLPDQTRAFFMSRGFRPEQAEVIAQSCVFQTVFKNISNQMTPAPIEYDLRNWQVIYNEHHGTMKTREDWRGQWQAWDVPEAARIAFEWALFPTHQVYQPGDYNWGMSVFGLKPGTTFDLRLSWQQYGESHTVQIEDLRCAPDIHPEPGNL